LKPAELRARLERICITGKNAAPAKGIKKAGADFGALHGGAERSEGGQRDDQGYDSSDNPTHKTCDRFFHCGISSFHIGTPIK